MFPTHTIDSAPEGSKETLTAVEKAFGFLPNLAGKLAEAPTALDGYITLSGIFTGPKASLSPVEQQVVLLATSAENGCTYCGAAHGLMAHGAGLSRDDVRAVQAGQKISDSKLEALRAFATAVVEDRGWVKEADMEAFLNAGYTHAQVLEVIVGVAVKTITNYTNHIVRPALDDQFADFAVAEQAAE